MLPPLGPNVRAVLQRAERAISARDPLSARADHRSLIGFTGTPAPILYRLGILEAEAGRADLAVSLIEAALARTPGDPNIVINLAQITLATDDAPRTVALLAELPAEIRRNPAVARLDGIARAATGDHEAAIPRLELARRSAPDDPVLLNNLGVCLSALGRIREAVAAFELVPDPGVELRINLSGLLMQLDQAERARGLLADGLRAMPDAAALHRQMAVAARALAHLTLAQRAARKAVILEPDVAAHAGVVADLAENRADLDHAGSWVARAMLIDPRTTSLRRLKLRITRRLRDTEGAVVLARNWLETETEPARRYPLLFELGQALDVLKRPGEAYESFRAANVAQREATPALIGNPARALEQIEGLNRLIGRGWQPKPEVSGQTSGGADAPVFLIGFPRSGTTLLDQVLDAHPNVAVIEERPLIPELIARLAEFGKHYPESLEHLSAAEVGKLRDHYLAARNRLVDPAPGQIVIDKMPLNSAHVALIRLVFPDARFILSLRDPCDVVLSCFMQAFQLNNWMAALLSLEGAAELYSAVFRHWELACEALDLPHVRIRYEDMVADLEAAVTPVLTFLGLDWRPDMARFHEHARTRSHLATPSAGQVTRPIYTDALARWRRYAEIEGAPMAAVAARLVEERRRYGYLEGPDPSPDGSEK